MRAKLRKTAAAEGTERLGEQPAELLDRLRFRVVLGEVLLDELLQRQRAADAFLPAEMFERPFECSAASHSEEKPPRCNRLEAGPSVRYRYAHIGLPSTARLLSSKT